LVVGSNWQSGRRSKAKVSCVRLRHLRQGMTSERNCLKHVSFQTMACFSPNLLHSNWLKSICPPFSGQARHGSALPWDFQARQALAGRDTVSFFPPSPPLEGQRHPGQQTTDRTALFFSLISPGLSGSSVARSREIPQI
jgi:hypothetical protein